MTIEVCSRSRSSVLTSFLTIVGLVSVIAFFALTLLPARVDHIGKHAKADDIRQRHRDGLCDQTKVYFAPSSGRLLILCQMSNADTTDLWGGIIYQITETVFNKITPKEGGATEVTVFAGSWYYWQGTITKDRYNLIANFPIIQRYAKMKGWIR